MSFLEALAGRDDVFSKAWLIPLNLDKIFQWEVLREIFLKTSNPGIRERPKYPSGKA